MWPVLLEDDLRPTLHMYQAGKSPILPECGDCGSIAFLLHSLTVHLSIFICMFPGFQG